MFSDTPPLFITIIIDNLIVVLMSNTAWNALDEDVSMVGFDSVFSKGIEWGAKKYWIRGQEVLNDKLIQYLLFSGLQKAKKFVAKIHLL